MKASVKQISVVAATAFLFTGCASTPQPVKDSAAITAAMMGQLKAEMEAFQIARQVSDASVLALTQTIRFNADEQRVLLNRGQRSSEAAGDTQTVQLFGRLKSLSDSVREDETALEEMQVKLNAELVTLLKPLPDLSPKLASAMSAMTVLGQDLPSQTQFDETLGVLRAVWKNTKDNRDKLKKAIAP